jgi:hypothetical protein
MQIGELRNRRSRDQGKLTDRRAIELQRESPRSGQELWATVDERTIGIQQHQAKRERHTLPLPVILQDMTRRPFEELAPDLVSGWPEEAAHPVRGVLAMGAPTPRALGRPIAPEQRAHPQAWRRTQHCPALVTGIDFGQLLGDGRETRLLTRVSQLGQAPLKRPVHEGMRAHQYQDTGEQ